MAIESRRSPSGHHVEYKRHDRVFKELKKDATPIEAFIFKINNDWVLNLACVIAYNMLMAMLPMSIALLAFLTFFLRSASIRNTVTHQLTSLFPGLAGQQNALDLAQRQLSQISGIISIITVVVGVLFGIFLFIVTEGCLDIIYRVRNTYSSCRVRVVRAKRSVFEPGETPYSEQSPRWKFHLHQHRRYSWRSACRLHSVRDHLPRCSQPAHHMAQ